MEVRIYDRDLNFKGVIENHTSLIWTRKYYEPGNFEIHAPITEQNLRLLAKGNIISKRGSSEAGVIEDIENEESDLKNEITAKGRFLSSYMDRRLIKSTVNFSGKIEVAMRNLLSGVTAIPLVELGTLNGFTETVEFQATMKNLNFKTSYVTVYLMISSYFLLAIFIISFILRHFDIFYQPVIKFINFVYFVFIALYLLCFLVLRNFTPGKIFIS